jgi:hypothetical protein
MTTVGMVGLSKVPVDYEEPLRKAINNILNEWEDCNILSGGAKGVDTFVKEECKKRGFNFSEFLPEKQSWRYFRDRNEDIANCSDIVYSFTIPVQTKMCYHHKKPLDHEKTAGCYTIRYAKKNGIPTRCVIAHRDRTEQVIGAV